MDGVIVKRFLWKLNANTEVPEHCCRTKGKRLRANVTPKQKEVKETSETAPLPVRKMWTIKQRNCQKFYSRKGFCASHFQINVYEGSI